MICKWCTLVLTSNPWPCWRSCSSGFLPRGLDLDCNSWVLHQTREALFTRLSVDINDASKQASWHAIQLSCCSAVFALLLNMNDRDESILRFCKIKHQLVLSRKLHGSWCNWTYQFLPQAGKHPMSGPITLADMHVDCIDLDCTHLRLQKWILGHLANRPSAAGL